MAGIRIQLSSQHSSAPLTTVSRSDKRESWELHGEPMDHRDRIVLNLGDLTVLLDPGLVMQRQHLGDYLGHLGPDNWMDTDSNDPFDFEVLRVSVWSTPRDVLGCHIGDWMAPFSGATCHGTFVWYGGVEWHCSGQSGGGCFECEYCYSKSIDGLLGRLAQPCQCGMWMCLFIR